MMIFNRNKKIRDGAYLLFTNIVRQARHVRFYKGWAVEDSLDGRFDLIVLHITLVIGRLERAAENKPMALLVRYLQEVMFDNMDLSLREMGVGDMSVGKKVKHMAEAFNGRRMAYLQALAGPHMAGAIKPVIIRNIYRENPPDNDILDQFIAYILCQVKFLEQQTDEQILAGELTFADTE